MNRQLVMSWARLDIRQKIILSQSKIIVRWDNLKLFRRELMQWPASTIYNGVFTVWQSSLVTRQLNGKTNLLLHCYFLFPPFLGKKQNTFDLLTLNLSSRALRRRFLRSLSSSMSLSLSYSCNWAGPTIRLSWDMEMTHGSLWGR